MNQDEYAWRAADSLNCKYLVKIYRLCWFLAPDALKAQSVIKKNVPLKNIYFWKFKLKYFPNDVLKWIFIACSRFCEMLVAEVKKNCCNPINISWEKWFLRKTSGKLQSILSVPSFISFLKLDVK